MFPLALNFNTWSDWVIKLKFGLNMRDWMWFSIRTEKRKFRNSKWTTNIRQRDYGSIFECSTPETMR